MPPKTGCSLGPLAYNGVMVGWLKDILEENRRTVRSWPAWKRGVDMLTREDIEFLANTEMSSGFKNSLLAHDSEQRDEIKNLKAELENYRSIAEKSGATIAISELALSKREVHRLNMQLKEFEGD